MGDRLPEVIQRIASGKGAEADFAELRTALGNGAVLQLGDRSVNIRSISGGEVQVGDRNYYQCDDAIKAIAAELHRQSQAVKPRSPEQIDFGPYLRSLRDDEEYQELQGLFTSTTVEGRKPQPVKKKFPSRLKLYVQTVKQEKKDEPESQEEQEQIEKWDVLAGLRQYATDNVVLIGKPGSGKSTSLQRLLWEEAGKALQNPGTKIPVLVKLRRCTSTIEYLIRDFFIRHQLQLEINAIEQLLQQGRLLLLLDGLNELSEGFRREAENFRDRYCKTTPIIVSTRDLSAGGTLGIKKALKMLPLTEPQMQEFVRGYLEEEGDKLFQQLKGDCLREFAETPLLLWMLCRVFANECIQAEQENRAPKLPNNLGLAFREFTQLYDQGTEEHQAIQQDAPVDSRKKWPKLLCRLAFRMHGSESVDPRLSISREEAEDIVTECLQQEGRTNARECAEQWLQDLLDYHLLRPVRQTNSEEHVEFLHQLIQEYYAAEKLLQRLPELSDGELKRDYLNYLKWTEPVALMLALVDEEAQALRVVKLAMDEVDLMLGARLAGEVRHQIQISTVAEIIKLSVPIKLKIKLLGRTNSFAAVQFLSPFMNANETLIRIQTIKALGAINSLESMKSLKKALGDSDEDIRWLAACELANFSDESAIPALQEALCDEKHHLRAILAIDSIDKARVIPLLGTTLLNKSAEARRKATTSLHLLMNKGYEGILPLLEIALHDTDRQVRCSAAHALKDASNDEARLIISQAWADEDMQVRSHVCASLGERMVFFLENDLRKALSDTDPELKKRAIDIISKSKFISKSIAQTLLKTAFFEPNFLIRNSASATLSMIDSSIVINILGDVLAESNEKIEKYRSKHSEAMTILSLIRERDSIPILTKVLLDPDKDALTKVSAIKILGEIGDSSTIPFLKANFQRAQEEFELTRNSLIFEHTCIQTILALTKLGVENLEDSIAEILQRKTTSIDVRKDCLFSLRKISTEKSKAALVNALYDENFSVRLSSALILSREGCMDCIKVLIEALGCRNSIRFEDSTVTRSAINALCELGEKCLPALEDGLNSQDFQVRKNSKTAIDRIKKIDNEEFYDFPSSKLYDSKYINAVIDSLIQKYSFVELVESLKNVNSDEAWKFASALKEIVQHDQVSQLYETLLKSDFDNIFNYVPYLISNIQGRSKFYDYDIWQESQAL